MELLSSQLIYQTVLLMAAQPDDDEDDEQLEAQVRALVDDELSVRRLLDVIPEAFGMVMVAHLPAAAGVILPDTFSAQDEDDEWTAIALHAEPIFAVAADIATHTFHNGPRAQMQAIAGRSSLLSAVSNALDAGHELDGATLGGPQFFGLPASLYRHGAA